MKDVGVCRGVKKTNGGALDGGLQCRMSILRNANVPCRYFCNFPVDFKITKCPSVGSKGRPMSCR